ncbi:hypothetical protein B0O99DRAFT_587042 [Bisporella sp. PMI_857]|nr:hypothetical protein B0O99DRAFT_587042 [Bisporella sp. PMI_857]
MLAQNNHGISAQTPLSSTTHHEGTETYEALRRAFYNDRVPDIKPAEIATPINTQGVSAALKHAAAQNWKVGVRSGGHQWTCSSLIEGGLLIDTRYLNHAVDFDPETKLVSFGPSVNGSEVSAKMVSVGRFFPHGHSPTVAVGGFLLAGGQGWFMRGWGLTSDTWITQIEIVTASGDTLIASETQNQDLFWSARGAGQGFFGVVTKFWCHTIPGRSLFQTTIVFKCGDQFEKIVEWALDSLENTQKEFVDGALCTFYADKNIPGVYTDELTEASTLMAAVALTAYTDTQEAATEWLKPWQFIPKSLENSKVFSETAMPTSWAKIFKEQDEFTPLFNNERWQVGSILTDPTTTRSKLISSLKPALCDLPTRRSIGCVYFAETIPDENRLCSSLPQQFYVASMVCWNGNEHDSRVQKWLENVYSTAAPAACGVYVADFNSTLPVTKVMTDSAFQKWMSIRSKWDPQNLFQGFRGFNSS